MGGAGIALIDTPVAARLNPARLASLSQPSAVIEAFARRYDGTRRDSGLVRFDPSINPFAGMQVEGDDRSDSSFEPGFLAYAHRLDLDRPLVLALSRTQVMDLSLGAASATRTTPLSAPVVQNGGDEVVRISRGRLDLEVELYDLAAGWRITPSFSVGGSLAVGRMDLSAETTGSLSDPLQFTVISMVDPRFSGSKPEPLVRTSTAGSDTDIAYSFGSHWKPHPALSLATVFRRGPRFEVSGVSRDLSSGRRESFTNVVKIPDTAAIGVAWTPFHRHPSARMQTLTIAFDLVRQETSDLRQGMREGESIQTRNDFVRKVSYDVKDETQAHLGLEYRVPALEWTLALRGGLYTQRDGLIHLQNASGDVGALQGQSRALQEGDFFPEGDTEVHGTLGAGAIFHSLIFDIGIDLSDPYNQVVASATYRFR